MKRIITLAMPGVVPLFGSHDTNTFFLSGETRPVAVVNEGEGNIRKLIEGILVPEKFEEKLRPLFRKAVGEKVRFR